MGSIKRAYLLAGVEAGERGELECYVAPPKCGDSVSTLIADAPPCSYWRAIARISADESSVPSEGDRRLISQMKWRPGRASWSLNEARVVDASAWRSISARH